MRHFPLAWIALFLVSILAPVQAQQNRLTCTINGIGSYVYDSATMIDYYTFEGDIEHCISDSGNTTEEQGNFAGTGFVATIGASGTGDMKITWTHQPPSTIDAVMTGIPELLVLKGIVTAGSYEGRLVEITMRCSLQDTEACFTLGSSTWSFSGTLTLVP